MFRCPDSQKPEFVFVEEMSQDEDVPCCCRLAMPDFLCMAHAFKFDKKSVRGEVPGWRDADDLARALQDAACSGTDPPLPVHLPHSKAIIHGRKGGCGSHDIPRNIKSLRRPIRHHTQPLVHIRYTTCLI
jgi:hypothetical protein